MPKTEIRDAWEIMAFIQKHRGAALVGDILDDHPKLVEWHENMLQGKPLHLIRQGLETVNSENMQTYIKYMETQR